MTMFNLLLLSILISIGDCHNGTIDRLSNNEDLQLILQLNGYDSTSSPPGLKIRLLKKIYILRRPFFLNFKIIRQVNILEVKGSHFSNTISFLNSFRFSVL